MKIIDLRSDTVTQPSASMRQAIFDAKVGDDVYGDDPSVNLLESIAAEMLAKESAIFVASGTQANLLALLVHCERGDEYIAGQLSHIYCEEGGGGAVLASIQPQPVKNENDGTLDLNEVENVIKDHSDFHFAKTALLCLENTMYGRVLPVSYLEKAHVLANKHNLKMHLDGARLYNAAVKLNVPVTKISQYFDSISLCLSKGLGAPVGSILCGSKEFIDKARRWRKVVGGGMRQAGFLAQAGIYALENNIERLADDHKRAQFLAQELNKFDEIEVLNDLQQTNMVFFKLSTRQRQEKLCADLLGKGIKILNEPVIRLVTHLDVNDEDIEITIKNIKNWLNCN